VARTGDEAMQLLGQQQVDVLLTDIVMPGINGIELARRAQRLHPNLKLMFMTGYSSRFVDAQELGKVVLKPFRVSEFIAVLVEVLAAE